MDAQRRPPSLVDLCTNVAIENVRYIGNVSGLDINLLERILPHCNKTQLAHIENCTKGTDLSPVTDKLWKRFYEMEFGVDNANMIIERMNRKQVQFTWKRLYEAKTKEREEAENKISQKLKQSYAESLAEKKSRQTKMTAKIPPPKRSFWGGNGPSFSTNYKSPLMKKAKIELLKSPEIINHKTMKRTLQSSSTSISRSVPTPTRPNNYSKSNGASSSSQGFFN
ncbi:transcription elongation factor B polypeptide 3 [Carex littledalei]|uniref:Transcription elongation factor B polypeptide 3 n=1 Tax=Carex littledalei TaxID=544730 RepID=A0A833QRR1_9POAL|nr:transcription elongation factor B polypeptide 3 [Carex littledalei]